MYIEHFLDITFLKAIRKNSDCSSVNCSI